MANEFRFYVLGLIFLVVGLISCVVAVMVGPLLILGPVGAICVVWGAALMDAVSWRDIRDYVRGVFH
jgi:hypothetical protein